MSERAIHSVERGTAAFCRFLAAIDTGLARTHQSGIYIPKSAWSLLFGHRAVRGENETRMVKVRWQGDRVLDNNFKYYGRAKNEYRITGFGRGFNLLRPENTGALFVLVQMDAEDYEAWVLETEDDIDAFLAHFGMSPTDVGQILKGGEQDVSALATAEQKEIETFVQTLGGRFPKAVEMSAAARRIYNHVYNHAENIVRNPDKELLAWNHTEYRIFRAIEEAQYGEQVRNGFSSMEAFIEAANSVLNRRKSRAGKSLEYHLSAIFDGNHLAYEAQVITEERKKPDFVFPSGKAYHDLSYPADKLIVLGAKTTCKDRWRQVVTEADRVKTKYLCTLQQGISPQQLHEMQAEHVVLVVPQEYIKTYPQEYQQGIFPLKGFIQFVRETLCD